MIAGGFAVGSAMLVPVEVRHDLLTAQSIDRWRRKLAAGSDAAVLAAAAAMERPQASRHPLCAEFRAYVDAELTRRDLSLAVLAGGAS